MTIFLDDREDAPEEEPVEGEVQEDATGEEAGDVEGDVEGQGQDEDEEADGNGGVAVQEKFWGGYEEDVDNDGEEDEGSDEESSDEGGGEYTEEEEEDHNTSENETEGQGSRTWKEFYSKENATTLKDQLLLNFCKHLQDILGGCKSERHAIDYAQDVRRIWDTLNTKDDSLGSLLADAGLHI